MYKLKSVSKLTLILISVVLLFSSCGITDPIVVKVKEKYSIDLPWGSMPSKNLNSAASLEYSLPGTDYFIYVIDESKEAFKKTLVDNKITEQFSNNLEGYTSLALLNIKNKLKEAKVSEIKDIKINNLNAKKAEMKGKINGVDLYYSITSIQGKDSYYQIISWRKDKSDFERKEAMDNAIFTFKEL